MADKAGQNKTLSFEDAVKSTSERSDTMLFGRKEVLRAVHMQAIQRDADHESAHDDAAEPAAHAHAERVAVAAHSDTEAAKDTQAGEQQSALQAAFEATATSSDDFAFTKAREMLRGMSSKRAKALYIRLAQEEDAARKWFCGVPE